MELEVLQTALLRAAETRDVGEVLQRLVEGLGAIAGVALVRIWLVGPGDQCSTCPMRGECAGNIPCLHLKASTGVSLDGTRWEAVDGQFRRFPLGIRKIGTVGARGESLALNELRKGSPWIVQPTWVEREQIESMAAHPLIFRNEILGVLAVFARRVLREDELRWLRLFADHAAVTIANSKAFAEVERLRRDLELENMSLRDELSSAVPRAEIVGESPALRATMKQVELVAKTDAAVLILGESGVGKELVARAVHEQSRRRKAPFIKVNCAAVPRELFESEYFGHIRGAFTGALRDRIGRFELAHGGTLFLDEIGEVPLELQSKLLRVIQEGTFERVGDERSRQVDVRIIAATNRELREEALAGRFRQDLYFRLGAFPIVVPPLRERKEDLPNLVAHFIRIAAQRLGFQAPRVTPEDLRDLAAYAFPGNIRELEHIVERALILGEGKRFDFVNALPGATRAAEVGRAHVPASQVDEVMTDAEMRLFERQNLERALERAGGQVYGKEGAAALLGLPATTVLSRLRAAGIAKKR